jgi:competence protein ComEC
MLALGIVCALCGVALPVLAALPAAPLGFLTEGYTAAVRLLATLPGAPIQAPLAPSPLLVAGYALLGVALVVVRPRRGSLALACVLASAPHFVGPVPAAAPALTLGAVGHGQAAVARLSDGAALVVDCGNLNDPRRAVREVLDALGPRRRIDHLVLSHGDADHAGGVSGLATRVPIAAAVLPVELRGSPLARTLAARGTALQFARPGEQLRPHPEVLVIAPAVGPRAARNDRSLWTLVEVGGQRVVLPGDAEAEGIRAALRELPDGPTTALVLPHHGRGPAASFERLLDELRPGLALVSTGGAAPMAAAVHARGIPLLSTYEHGALRLELDGPARVSAARPRQSVPIEAGRR